MERKQLTYAIIVGVLGVLTALAACSPAAVPSGAADEEQQIEAVVEPTATATPSPTFPPLNDLEEWDLVWVSDSSGWGVAQVFGDMVAEDTGKTVNVHDLWEGGFAAGEMLEILQGDYTGPDYKFQKLPETIAEAEIIVFYGNPERSENPDRPGDWSCIPSGPWYVTDCDPEIFTVYKEHVKEIFRLILEAREGQPTIIRTYDAYNPLINQFRDAGVYEECKACWGYFNDAMREAAAEMGIPLAPVAERWNGPDWTIDPDDDLDYTKDHIHPNALGAEVIAQALRELGYDPVQNP